MRGKILYLGCYQSPKKESLLQSVRISILTTFHNREDDAEHLLSEIYAIISEQDELIIIDDASSDETAQIIASVVENSGHENTYFLQNDEYRGRGVALQQAWEQANGKLIWLVDRAPEIDADLLEGASNLLLQSEALSTVLGDFSVPKDIQDWLQLLDTGSFPADVNFLWNNTQFPKGHKFTSPYWQQFHALEMTIRLFKKGHFITTESHYDVLHFAVDSKIKRRFLLHLLSVSGISEVNFNLITERIGELSKQSHLQDSNIDTVALLQQARAFMEDGNPVEAIDKLDQILLSVPDHIEAKNLKVQSLNKMRRYVEAAELKHKLKSEESALADLESISDEDAISDDSVIDEEIIEDVVDDIPIETSEDPAPIISNPDVKLSVIIPAAGLAKERTLECLASLFEHEATDSMEIFVIDNACLDETVAEVTELYGDQITIIRNRINSGFGPSVNNAILQANSEFIAVLHNDVVLENNALSQLREHLISQPEYGLLAPMAEATLNSFQLWGNRDQLEETIAPVEYTDSFCMVFRRDAGVQFDTSFELAFFEDMDFSYQMREAGLHTGIVTDLKVQHAFGATMREFGLNLLEKEHWKNQALFNKKWQMEPSISEEFIDMPQLQQLILIGQSINVLYPEQHLVDYMLEILTSELKTDIQKASFFYPELNAMIRVMMAIDQRDILRKLEEELETSDIDRELSQLLITYYFDRNIYSRCKKYISEFDKNNLPFALRLYEAKIAVNERDLDFAAECIAVLGKERPAHPELHKLAGELSELNGNESEAKEYFTTAAMINPYKFDL